MRTKEQVSKDNKKWYLKNKEKKKEYDKEWQIFYRYGITRQDYIDMLTKQHGKCAICGEPETDIDGRSGKVRQLSVDHCHITKKVRGLLCVRCNHGIGKLRDSIPILQSAIEYLRNN
ncbi:Recombination endonuclease VII [uncultured Caudovirales phage]|uniref:Recombination endonuclease VII n=1 Tax=uncultured Caudovirales phage TaxID=2100421 RepID=A0A6J5SPB6_9CAUD|nr:Recombination endonuclease VII [uncultured Caudovirales phage]